MDLVGGSLERSGTEADHPDCFLFQTVLLLGPKHVAWAQPIQSRLGSGDVEKQTPREAVQQ